MFLPRARALLRSAAHAAADTRAAAEPSRITIGYTGGIIVTPAVRELLVGTPTPTCTLCIWHGTRRVRHCSITGWTPR